MPAATSAPRVPDHELLRPIGRGSYGDVWLARNVVGTLRAVKIVYRSTFERNEHFEREFRGIQKFEPISRSHEGFVDILQIGRNHEEGYFYYVMELADDAEVSSPSPTGVEPFWPPLAVASYCPKTLRAELQRCKRFPARRCIRVHRRAAARAGAGHEGAALRDRPGRRDQHGVDRHP